MTIKTNEDVLKEWFVKYFESYVLEDDNWVFNNTRYNKLVKLMLDGLMPWVDYDHYRYDQFKTVKDAWNFYLSLFNLEQLVFLQQEFKDEKE